MVELRLYTAITAVRFCHRLPVDYYLVMYIRLLGSSSAVECLTLNQYVVGSIPTFPSKYYDNPLEAQLDVQVTTND